MQAFLQSQCQVIVFMSRPLLWNSMVEASTVASHQEGFRFESPGGQEHFCAVFSPCASALQVVLREIAELAKIN